MRTWVVAALTLPLVAQEVNPSLFKGDPKQIMLACADRALAINPRKARVMARVGRAYLVAGDQAKAETLFKSARGGDAETQRIMGQAWLEAGNPTAAKTCFECISGTGLSEKNTMTAAAVLMMDAGQFKTAEYLMNAAFTLGPRDWQNVTQFGRACLRQSRQDMAAQWFARAVNLRRKEEGLWNEMALAFANGGAER